LNLRLSLMRKQMSWQSLRLWLRKQSYLTKQRFRNRIPGIKSTHCSTLARDKRVVTYLYTIAARSLSERIRRSLDDVSDGGASAGSEGMIPVKSSAPPPVIAVLRPPSSREGFLRRDHNQRAIARASARTEIRNHRWKKAARGDIFSQIRLDSMFGETSDGGHEPRQRPYLTCRAGKKSSRFLIYYVLVVNRKYNTLRL
jgi:hypothetical protein